MVDIPYLVIRDVATQLLLHGESPAAGGVVGASGASATGSDGLSAALARHSRHRRQLAALLDKVREIRRSNTVGPGAGGVAAGVGAFAAGGGAGKRGDRMVFLYSSSDDRFDVVTFPPVGSGEEGLYFETDGGGSHPSSSRRKKGKS